MNKRQEPIQIVFIRVPASIKQELVARAKEDNRTLSGYLTHVIKRMLAATANQPKRKEQANG